MPKVKPTPTPMPLPRSLPPDPLPARSSVALCRNSAADLSIKSRCQATPRAADPVCRRSKLPYSLPFMHRCTGLAN
uniref:Predicted protein n=1 Tax=Hordeum vulgare subsp. vulgare TaxID=112509 RepID=F2E9S7_HORVV|nr:predicted protein [Hordeum vulgare subsp. vulgare]